MWNYDLKQYTYFIVNMANIIRREYLQIEIFFQLKHYQDTEQCGN